MCAYNSINGQPACVNEFLLQDQLRGKWNFQGYVVSDCGAVINIFVDHHFTKTQAEASALSLQRGMDNECVDFFAKVNDDHDYKPYLDAYKQGILKESEIDTTLVRLFTARMKLGMFDPPEMVPYSKIDEKELDSAEHRAMARAIANEAMVLLKNDGTLPLKTRHQNRSRRAAGGPDEISAGQLQRNSDAHGFRAGRAQSGVSRCADHVCAGNAVSAERRRVGSGISPDHARWAAGAQGGVFHRRSIQRRESRPCWRRVRWPRWI